MMKGWKQAMWLLTMLIFKLLFVKANNLNFDVNSNKQLPYSVDGSNALARSALVERQEKLQYNCEEVIKFDNNFKKIYEPDDFQNILVDDKHELLYCYVPKVSLN